jgi:hypothetical protein
MKNAERHAHSIRCWFINPLKITPNNKFSQKAWSAIYAFIILLTIKSILLDIARESYTKLTNAFLNLREQEDH